MYTFRHACSQTYMSLYVYACTWLYICMHMCMHVYKVYPHVTVHTFDVTVKYDCHIVNLIKTTIILHVHIEPTILHMCAKNNQQPTAILLHMLLSCMGQQQMCLSICHVCKLVHVPHDTTVVSINTSYKLIANNNMTRNAGIHTFSYY